MRNWSIFSIKLETSLQVSYLWLLGIIFLHLPHMAHPEYSQQGIAWTASHPNCSKVIRAISMETWLQQQQPKCLQSLVYNKKKGGEILGMIWAVFVEPQHMLCTVSKYFVTCGNIIWDSLAALNRLWFRTIIDSNPELDNNFVRSLVQTLTFVALIEKCRVWSNSPSSSSFRVQLSVKVRIWFGLSLCDGLPVTNCQNQQGEKASHMFCKLLLFRPRHRLDWGVWSTWREHHCWRDAGVKIRWNIWEQKQT